MRNMNCSININDGTLESFLESYNETLFEELAKEFFEEEPGFDSFLEAYIENESAFGD